MTTLGLSIATEHDYDIVTPSSEFHETLLSTRTDRVFDALLAQRPTPALTAAQARHELGLLVISLTDVNLRALRPEDIPELQASRHFSAFQALIRRTARSINRGEDGREYERDLRSTADDIIDAWHQTGNELSRGVKDALFEHSAKLSGDVLSSLLSPVAKVLELAIKGGVSVVLLTRKGQALRQKKKGSPYQFLTEVVSKQHKFLRATFPLGLER